MASSSGSAYSSKTIFDLNDDCLREVFEYLNMMDLCAVADVCTRFKGIAQTQFPSLEHKRFLFRNVDNDRAWGLRKNPADVTTLTLTQISKILRNFGASIEEIIVGDEFEKFCEKHQKGIVDLLARFCSEKLVKLQFWRFDITDEIAHQLQPVLRSLQVLSLKNCTWGDLLKMLPTWSPELEELNFDENRMESSQPICIFDGLRQNFPKLQRFSFESVELGLYVIRDFVKFNPQIKEATFKDYYNLSALIFRMIVKHLPLIERLSIDSQGLSNAKYFSQLPNLKSLSIDADSCSELSLNVCEIDFANIPLEYLELHDFDLSWEFDQVIVALSELKNLKRLKLSQVSGMSAAHIVTMCENHSQLIELHLIDNERLALSIQNLLDILQIATKLEKLFYSHDPLARECSDDDSEPEFEDVDHETVVSIDTETYEKFVQVVYGRPHKTYLSISSPMYCACEIPDKLLELHESHFELSVNEDDEEGDEYDDEASDKCEGEDDEAYVDKYYDDNDESDGKIGQKLSVTL